MSEAFDPYYDWLGIPTSKRPPSDCDLVGVEEGETDLDRIREAARARIEQIRSYTLGPQREHALRILNEVSDALASLLKTGLADTAEIEKPPPLPDVATESGQAAAPEATAPSAELRREDTPETKEPPPLVRFASEPEQPADPPEMGIELAADVPQDERGRSRSIVALVLVPVLLVDRILRHVSGEENDILHNFMRVVAVVLVASSFVGLIWMMPRFVNAVFVANTQRVGSDAGMDQPEEASPPTPPDGADTDAGEAATKATLSDEPLLATITNSIGMKLLLIPSGEFLMGSPDSDEYADDMEKPQHLVRITKPLYLGVTEVTQEQYERVMGENPNPIRDDPQLPVRRVSWNDAVEFCRRLSEKEDETYQLPTEAQWEYACRAGSTTQWWFGDDKSQLGDYAWCSDNSDRATYPVAQKKPNGWGLYDMHGNVYEWCADWYGDYADSPSTDPTGPSSSLFRVSRGGSWISRAGLCRSAYRYAHLPGFEGNTLGFRVSLVPAGGSGKPQDEEQPKEFASETAEMMPPEQEEPPPEPARVTDTPSDRAPPLNTITNSIGMKLVLIPAGEFMMGSYESAREVAEAFDSKPEYYEHEHPQHLVKITKPFYLGVTEVTQEQYEQVTGENPSKFKGDPQRPVETVSWEDTVKFCERLSEKEGKTYRLPTEAEWEYACRAGSSTNWCFGDSGSQLEDYVWYRDNSADTTHPVGQKKPNAWGLFDMHGNVSEWCADRYDENYYTASPAIDPEGSDSGRFRVVRGGTWGGLPAGARSAYRFRFQPGYRNQHYGFRLARAGGEAKESGKLEEEARREDLAAVEPGPGRPKGDEPPEPGEPIPKEKEPVTFICREGRVLFVDVEGIQRIAQTVVLLLIQRLRLDREPAADIDGETLVNVFNGLPMEDGDGLFNVKLAISGQVPRLVLERQEGAGETAEELKQSGSRYEQWVERIDPTTSHIQFLVWPDSAETYLAARKLAADRGLLTVRRVQTTSEEHTILLGDDLRTGPPARPPEESPARAPPPPSPVAPSSRPAQRTPRDEPLPDTITNSIGMKLVLISAGEFLMGSPISDRDAKDNERPQHTVRIAKPFYLGVYEVTQEQYQRGIGENPSRFTGDPKRPVESVSWEKAVEFCRRLGQKEAKQYRLPTEAEWEYACQAGRSTKWCFGDAESQVGGYAWYGGNSDKATHPAGQKQPNAWGLYDMHGNVWEWCSDKYGDSYYAESPSTDPTGPSFGASQVVRGGSWSSPAGRCRSAYRRGNITWHQTNLLGFRVCLEISN